MAVGGWNYNGGADSNHASAAGTVGPPEFDAITADPSTDASLGTLGAVTILSPGDAGVVFGNPNSVPVKVTGIVLESVASSGYAQGYNHNGGPIASCSSGGANASHVTWLGQPATGFSGNVVTLSDPVIIPAAVAGVPGTVQVKLTGVLVADTSMPSTCFDSSGNSIEGTRFNNYVATSAVGATATTDGTAVSWS